MPEVNLRLMRYLNRQLIVGHSKCSGLFEFIFNLQYTKPNSIGVILISFGIITFSDTSDIY